MPPSPSVTPWPRRTRYIGDGLPLCKDLPPRAFLRRGATYRFLGYSSQPHQNSDPASRETDARFPDFLLEPGSNLTTALCNPHPSTGACRYESQLSLAANLACVGGECDIAEPRLLFFAPAGQQRVYYEYVRMPCVQLALYNSPGLVEGTQTLCADRAEASAGTWRDLRIQPPLSCSQPRLPSPADPSPANAPGLGATHLSRPQLPRV